jgi:Icc-related predicted phosphoesterase
MRVLAFSDLHGSVTAAAALVRQAGDADVVVGAGDFGNQRQGWEGCIRELRAIRKPTVLVPGNNESFDELRAACAGWANAHVLHGTTIRIGDVTFFGLGGGIPVTPFGAWSWDFSEEQATQLLANCPPGCVLVSHSPPKGLLDVSSSGASLGSVAVRDAVDRLRPKLVVCGHIHASGGKTMKHHSTVVVNAGPGGLVCDVTP